MIDPAGACCCVGPQDGEPLCPCRMRRRRALSDAAPDMLAMLKDIRGFLKRSGYDVRLVDAVIAKAEGRS